MAKDTKKLVLIDGNAIIHRSYHALPPLSTKTGELVNAVYGFSSTLLSVIANFKPEYIVATFDLAGPTFRHKEFADYKATRVKAPDELYAQIGRVKEVVRAMGIPIYEKEGFEADDVIGTIVRQCEDNCPDVENIIVTGDLDTLQLVNGKTKVWTMKRGLTDAVLYGEGEVMERYGLKPKQLIDFKGLRGDVSDNIPGVKGIGEKTACELLKKYGTLEHVYEKIGEIKGATKDKLERDKAVAAQSKRLATIELNVPIEFSLEETKTHEFDRNRLVKLFSELNFYSLIKRIPDNVTSALPVKSSAEGGRLEEQVFHGVKDFKYEYIKPEKTKAFLEEAKEQKEIALELKTIGSNALLADISGISFSWKTGRAYYMEWTDAMAEYIKEILENKETVKVGCNLKESIKTLARHQIKMVGPYFDVAIAAYVLNPGTKVDLEKLVLEKLGEEIVPKNKKGQLGLEIESAEEISHKMCQRTDYIWKLKDIYREELAKVSREQEEGRTMENIFYNIETPLIEILTQMEILGIKLNTTIFKGISEKINKRIKNLEEAIYELAGEKFNINSSRQLASILFEKLAIPTLDIKKGKTGYSTAATELQKISARSGSALGGKDKNIIAKIEDYREAFKLKTTYLDTLPELVDENSRIHTVFNQTVTATGRLSSSEPNLQNIPTRTDLGQLMRVAFEADEGWKLVSADYSQIDLRSVAHVSGDEKMIELFKKGEDIHRATAAEVNKVSISKVTEKMRSAAKALNFGVIYGMSVFGFSQSAGIDRDEAKKFIDEYMKRFQGIARYMRETKEKAKVDLFVQTEMGRRRYIPEINSPNFQVQNAAERMAINMPIQGMSADIVKLAMIKTHEEYKNDPDVRMLLQIHDEIIWEVKELRAKEVSEKIKEIMENVYKMKVSLEVHVGIGDNWGEI